MTKRADTYSACPPVFLSCPKRPHLWQLVLWILGRLKRFEVNGQSMEPALKDGDTVLVDPRAYRTRSPRVGEIVLAKHPYRTEMMILKRVAAVDETQGVELRGDNPAQSTDSSSFGRLEPEQIIGPVVARMM